MKTLEQLHKDILASDELKHRFFEAAKSGEAMTAFLKEQDCGATFAEYAGYMKSQNDNAALSDSDVEAVAGGKNSGAVTTSVFTAGIVCAFVAAGSAMTSLGAGGCMEKL